MEAAQERKNTIVTQSKVHKFLWLAPCIAGTIIATGSHVHSQATEQDYQPKIVRSQDDGVVFYQRIQLKNDNIQFFEGGTELDSYGRFVKYSFRQDKVEQPNKVIHLSDFRLVLNAESPQRYQGTPGGQVMLPVSNSTAYQDLDGDSVLDTMTKNGPAGSQSYILYHDQWVEVQRFMSAIGFEAGRPVSSIDGKTKYIFAKGQWRIKL